MRLYKFIPAEYALETLSKRRVKVTTIEELNDPFELLPFEMRDRNKRSVLCRTKAEIALTRGMLCFSATWRDPVLWAHYASQHKGICIGFNIPDELCKPVTYISQRMPFPDLTRCDEMQVAADMLFKKYVNWQYEQEVRLWVALSEKEDGRYYCYFDNTLVPATVIVGAQCTQPKSAFDRALEGLSYDVALIKARPGFSDFEIVRDKCGFR